MAKFKTSLFHYKDIAISVSTFNGLLGVYVRRYFYSSTLKKCGDGLTVFFGAYICYEDVAIGNDCTIEEYSLLSRCELGNDVVIAAGVSVMSGAHHHNIRDLDTLFRKSQGLLKTVRIGDNTWIGTKSVIMNDIAANSIVGAGAVVTRPVNEFDIVAGVPAKVIGSRKA
ncbi:CheW protein [Saccharophagus degradans 2-40]|uniref:CheW protein n=1 Tax=Saccharophagus degradans (strain 2-40 / ATCC 43961 / DSM 17024) TaxID=203122 RepID=Q21IU7_SACD2|nr:CheW protein [Saccharophagus degradans 2-40]